MGLPIGYGFTHDFALCRSAGAVRHFHRLRHAFSVQMVWYLSLTYGQAHRLSSGTLSACFSHKHLFSSKQGCKAPSYLCRPTQLRFVAAREADGFRCAPEERGITAYGQAHRLWIHPRFCALQERGSGLTVASLPHFMCRRHFCISHFAFRIPPSACLFYTQKIRNRAAHTLFDSFATAPFFFSDFYIKACSGQASFCVAFLIAATALASSAATAGEASIPSAILPLSQF